MKTLLYIVIALALIGYLIALEHRDTQLMKLCADPINKTLVECK